MLLSGPDLRRGRGRPAVVKDLDRVLHREEAKLAAEIVLDALLKLNEASSSHRRRDPERPQGPP
jgi:hypothetical protein